MADAGYVAAAVTAAVAVTVTLRALPFVARRTVRDSALLADLGRWLPLGAVTILAVYCLSLVEVTDGRPAAGPTTGIAVTVALHLWRRNTVLSIVAGTAACVLVGSLL